MKLHLDADLGGDIEFAHQNQFWLALALAVIAAALFVLPMTNAVVLIGGALV